jgi:hypothetical protein
MRESPAPNIFCVLATAKVGPVNTFMSNLLVLQLPFPSYHHHLLVLVLVYASLL